jgi:hypothetical protein
MPREWTDLAEPSRVAVLGINPPPILDGPCLLQLAELVSALRRNRK